MTVPYGIKKVGVFAASTSTFTRGLMMAGNLTVERALDMWAEQQFQGRLANVLTMRPSEYIARNVRVTPFHFEPVAYYLERYPNLADVYCYSSDYPHFEGGKESKRIFAEALSGVSAELRDKFFFGNATLLLPE